MQVKVGNYTNQKINGNTNIRSQDCTLVKVNPNGVKMGLGGVNHFTKKSIDTLVKYYVRRLQRDGSWGFHGAKYTIEITLSNVETDKEEMIQIPISCV